MKELFTIIIGLPLLIVFLIGPFYFAHRFLKNKIPKWHKYFTNRNQSRERHCVIDAGKKCQKIGQF